MATADTPSELSAVSIATPLTRGDMYSYALPGVGVTFIYTLTLVICMKYVQRSTIGAEPAQRSRGMPKRSQ